MKRVSLLAVAAVPATLGLALAPSAAGAVVHTSSKQADGSGKSVSIHPLVSSGPYATPDGASGCADELGGKECMLLYGHSNDVSSIRLSAWPHAKLQKDSLRIGYKINNGAYHSKWKTYDFSWNGSFAGRHEWYPRCSFPTTTHLTGYSTGPNKVKATLRVYGSDYRDTHPCG
jgi:hypothetical protein